MIAQNYPIPEPLTAIYNQSPVAVGGVGGSGTRLVAELLSGMGIFMGTTLNKASDNLNFVKSRELLKIPDQHERSIEIAKSFRNFELHMHEGFELDGGSSWNWGWKVPGQFHLLNYTAKYFSGARYIHVIRHGLDMAFSKNKNQVKNWGPYLGITGGSEGDPVSALQYWIEANQWAIEQGNNTLRDRFLLLNFDELCASPEHNIRMIARFIFGNDELSSELMCKLITLVDPPKSINRYKAHDFQNIFDDQSIESVRKLGFSI